MVANVEALLGSSANLSSELFISALAIEELKSSKGDLGRVVSVALKGFVETSSREGLSIVNFTGDADCGGLEGVVLYSFSSSDRGGGRGGLVLDKVGTGVSSSSNFSQSRR